MRGGAVSLGVRTAVAALGIVSTFAAPAQAAGPQQQCACIVNRAGDLSRTNASVSWGRNEGQSLADLPDGEFRSYCFQPPAAGKSPVHPIFRLPNFPNGEPARVAFELRLAPRRTAVETGQAICASLDVAAVHAIVHQRAGDPKSVTLIFNVSEFAPEKKGSPPKPAR